MGGDVIVKIVKNTRYGFTVYVGARTATAAIACAKGATSIGPCRAMRSSWPDWLARRSWAVMLFSS